MKLGQYSKTVAALVGSVLTWAGAAYIPSGHVTRDGWYALALAVATAAGVYGVTNAPGARKQTANPSSVSLGEPSMAEPVADPYPGGDVPVIPAQAPPTP